MERNIEQSNKCNSRLNCKCIIGVALITMLAIATSYLYVQYTRQTNLINNQLGYIAELKTNLVSRDMTNGSATSSLTSAFLEDNWVSFRHPWLLIDNMLLNNNKNYWNSSNLEHYYNQLLTKTTETEYIITAVIAGFAKEEISIELVDNFLMIKASHSNDKTENEKNTISQNKSYYSVKIPNDIDQDGITSELNNGILTIKIPRIKVEKEVKKLNIT